MIDSGDTPDAGAVSGAGAQGVPDEARVMVPAASAERVAEPRVHPFMFTGNARDYFRIWIVNLFLSVITLGLYSPWAKVRKKRYFYGHTWVAGANFEYHGNPVAILKGRLVALVIVGIYYGVGKLAPGLVAITAIAMLVLAPWFIVRSMAFNAFNSSYRNLRFRFSASYAQALLCVAPLLPGLLAMLFVPEFNPESGKEPPKTLFLFVGLQMVLLVLAYPAVVAAIRRLHIRGSQYGSAAFDCHAKIRSVYWIYVKSIFVMMGIGLVVGLVLGAVGAALVSVVAMIGGAPKVAGEPGVVVFALIGIGVFLMYLALGTLSVGYVRSRIGNLFFRASTLDDARLAFISTLKARRLMLIYAGNVVAILLTLGLAVPWAVMRVAHYRASCLALSCEGDIEDLVAGIARPVSALGDEVGEFLNIDLSL